MHPVQSSTELPQRPNLLQHEYPSGLANPWQEYLFPQDPSGEIVRPPGRTVGLGVAEVVDDVAERVDVLEVLKEEDDEEGVVLGSTVVDEEEDSVVVNVSEEVVELLFKVDVEVSVLEEDVIVVELEVKDSDVEVEVEVAIDELLVLVEVWTIVVVILGGSPEQSAIEFNFCLT